MMARGASLLDVRDVLGHADIKTTGIYLASERPDLARAVKRLPKIGLRKRTATGK